MNSTNDRPRRHLQSERGFRQLHEDVVQRTLFPRRIFSSKAIASCCALGNGRVISGGPFCPGAIVHGHLLMS